MTIPSPAPSRAHLTTSELAQELGIDRSPSTLVEIDTGALEDIAEEMGFGGILLMMFLYLIFIWRMVAVAVGARDRAGALMIMGFVALIGFHILCNLGMVVGMLPIMGIPLPLMSSGGTAVISMFIGVGLALSVRRRRFVN